MRLSIRRLDDSIPFSLDFLLVTLRRFHRFVNTDGLRVVRSLLGRFSFSFLRFLVPGFPPHLAKLADNVVVKRRQ